MKFLFALTLFAAVVAGGAETNFTPLNLEGQTFSHDPSTIEKDRGRYFSFNTGPGIRTKSSPDLIHWTNGDAIFATPPAWTLNLVPAFKGVFWAPDLVRVDGKFFLYYSCSTMGKQVSAIGLATSPTLDTTATNYFWKDCGPVIASTEKLPFNTIDPSAFLDTDGKLWLAFGS